jgi:glycerol-3-phosphate dehydrogenase
VLQAGAQIRLATECVAINRQHDGTFELVSRPTGSTDAAELVEEEFDVLVNAAGLWSRQFSEDIMGLSFADHPCMVIQHQCVTHFAGSAHRSPSLYHPVSASSTISHLQAQCTC